MLGTGQPGDPVTELTCTSWVLMSPAEEAELNKLMCRKTFLDDYENLCRLYVMGIPNIVRDNSAVHHDFKDQLKRSKDGWYETSYFTLLHCETANWFDCKI